MLYSNRVNLRYAHSLFLESAGANLPLSNALKRLEAQDEGFGLDIYRLAIAILLQENAVVLRIQKQAILECILVTWQFAR